MPAVSSLWPEVATTAAAAVAVAVRLAVVTTAVCRGLRLGYVRVDYAWRRVKV